MTNVYNMAVLALEGPTVGNALLVGEFDGRMVVDQQVSRAELDGMTRNGPVVTINVLCNGGGTD
jgi:hypothetical protein